MAEVRFYHLTGSTLEQVLPVMLERCLERGWRAVLRGASQPRLEALDRLLWTWRDESFLPHGLAGAAPEGPEVHPVWLTAGEELPAGTAALFLIDGAAFAAEVASGLETVALLFDGRDPAAVDRARADWRQVVAAGLKAVYWAEDGNGGWVRRAEAGGTSRS
ncbi:DNA polymerase III subunit chi [Paralimibaculum aggregatum]|uniref:DNA polymerase III subunit chi n=1 Tax=Paralimibaculum aggregatum TaxID=3036245 RepID=A0ABQ6LN98_9RHOB|nr:DNA polymerase III subunit chi [Limibaculum sp. NKW23]GMG82298.1 DNA polymerase III subunit chi [Limibaculum sp. NKW23]